MSLKDVWEREPTGDLRGPKPSGRILLSPETAEVVRKLARYQGLTLDEFVQLMLSVYVPQRLPNLELVYESPEVPREAEAQTARKARTAPKPATQKKAKTRAKATGKPQRKARRRTKR